MHVCISLTCQPARAVGADFSTPCDTRNGASWPAGETAAGVKALAVVRKLLESDQLYHGLAPIYVAPETGLMSGDSKSSTPTLRRPPPCCLPVGCQSSLASPSALPLAMLGQAFSHRSLTQRRVATEQRGQLVYPCAALHGGAEHCGCLAGAQITLGARGDSFYEYLLKQWILGGKKQDYLLQGCVRLQRTRTCIAGARARPQPLPKRCRALPYPVHLQQHADG